VIEESNKPFSLHGYSTLKKDDSSLKQFEVKPTEKLNL